MNYIDKIKRTLEQIDVGRPIFDILLFEANIRPVEQHFDPKFQTEGFYEFQLQPHIRRSFSDGEYKLNMEYIQGRTVMSVMEYTRLAFIGCSTSKEPKRTKLYKQISAMLDENHYKTDFVNSIFDIAEYFYSVTRTESIRHESNKKHRENIYQLLYLMEQRYGKTKENSNR